MSQILSSGAKSLIDRYGKVGVRPIDKPVRLSPTRMFWSLFGHPGAGKSTLPQTCEAALILNLDMATLSPSCKAQVVPYLDELGMPVGLAGERISLTWDWLKSLQKTLLDLALRGQPRPEMIVIDTLSSLQQIAEAKFGSDFSKMRSVYDEMFDFLWDLRMVGYGICVVSHIVRNKYNLKDAKGQATGDYGYRDEFTHSPKLHSRLFPKFELVLQIWYDSGMTVTEVDETVMFEGKEISTGKRAVSTPFTKFYASADPRHLTDTAKEILKRRALFPPKVDITGPDSWKLFEDAYILANKEGLIQ